MITSELGNKFDECVDVNVALLSYVQFSNVPFEHKIDEFSLRNDFNMIEKIEQGFNHKCFSFVDRSPFETDRLKREEEEEKQRSRENKRNNNNDGEENDDVEDFPSFFFQNYSRRERNL